MGPVSPVHRACAESQALPFPPPALPPAPAPASPDLQAGVEPQGGPRHAGGARTGSTPAVRGSGVRSPQPGWGGRVAQAPKPSRPLLTPPSCLHVHSPPPSTSARHCSQSHTQAWAGHLPARNASSRGQGSGAVFPPRVAGHHPCPTLLTLSNPPTRPSFRAPGALEENLPSLTPGNCLWDPGQPTPLQRGWGGGGGLTAVAVILMGTSSCDLRALRR